MRRASTTRSRPCERRGRAYVRFGVEHPEHYRIMFMGPAYATPDDWNDLLATGSFAHLIDGLRAVADAGLVEATHRGGAADDRAPRVGQHPRAHLAARGPARTCPGPTSSGSSTTTSRYCLAAHLR